MAWPNDYVADSIRTQILNYFYPGGIPTPARLGTDYTGEKAIQNWRTDIGSSEGILLVPAGYIHEERLTAEIDRLDNNQIIMSEDPPNKGKIDFIFDADTSAGNIGLETGLTGAIMDIAMSVDGSAFESDTLGIIGAGGYLIGVVITGIKGHPTSPQLNFGIQLQTASTYLIDSAITDTDGWSGDTTYQVGFNCARGIDGGTGEPYYHIIKNLTISAAIEYSMRADGVDSELINTIVQNGVNTLFPDSDLFTYDHCAIDQNINLDTDGYTLLESDGLGFPQNDPVCKWTVPTAEDLAAYGLTEPYLFKSCFYDNSDDSLIGCEEDLEPEDTAMVLWEGDHTFPIYYYMKVWQWDGSEYSILIADESGGAGTEINNQLFYPDDINGDTFTADSWDRGADSYYQEEDNTDPNTTTKPELIIDSKLIVDLVKSNLIKPHIIEI